MSMDRSPFCPDPDVYISTSKRQTNATLNSNAAAHAVQTTTQPSASCARNISLSITHEQHKALWKVSDTYRKTFTSYEHSNELAVKLLTTTTSATTVKETLHTTQITTSCTVQLQEDTEKDFTSIYNTINAIHQHTPATS